MMEKQEANEIISFNDGRRGNKNETRAYTIIKIFLLFMFSINWWESCI